MPCGVRRVNLGTFKGMRLWHEIGMDMLAYQLC
jgi:hypothetical protein